MDCLGIDPGHKACLGGVRRKHSDDGGGSHLGKLHQDDYVDLARALVMGCEKQAAEKVMEERKVQAQERAAAAAEQANKIEAQKICIRITGSLCPAR